MAKKKTLYDEIEVEQLKIQLKSTIEYLKQISPYELTDRIGEKYINGNLLPYIISTVEDQMRTALSSVKTSAGYIIAIYNKEGISEELKNDIEVTVQKLDEIREYYQKLRLTSIEDRKHWLLVGYRGRGANRSEVYDWVIAATAEKQVEYRNRFIDEILKIVPQINIIKSYSDVTGRGGVKITEAMKRFINRRHELVDSDD